MVVHVRLRVRSRKGKVKELVVLVNGGAHSPEPVLVVDEETARELGYEKEGRMVEASVADATRKVYLVENALELTLMGEEEELSKISAHLVIHPNLEEPLITDTTIDEMGIQVIRFSEGLWRHIKDPPKRVRKSALEQDWL